ncbi:MAG TPA: NfeD family protein [Alphaproteobacteria bacterium]|nr:NfeD family protein [Alphaproteobacteria bacterium]USO04680.1 MAG: NfeD family protein [Rhodospirillales bacterium]HOO81751.1 NfeD family protein [Alphaproteobacteria bacterium]
MELFVYNLEEIVYWHWLVLAGVFFILEILSMSFFFLWIGVSAVIMGVLVLIAPEVSWQLQFSIWAALSVIGAVGWRVYKKNNPNAIKSDQPNLNKRGDQYVGRTFTLAEPITNGFGKVKVDDSIWKVECKTDLEAGAKVKVAAVDGTVLQVEAVE